MKKFLVRALWTIVLLAVAGMIISFAINQFSFAFILMAFLVLLFGAMGRIYSVNNAADQFKQSYDRNNGRYNYNQEDEWRR